MYKKNAWKKYNGDYKAIFDFNEGYKTFITNGKTERLAVNETLKLAKEKGHKVIAVVSQELVDVTEARHPSNQKLTDRIVYRIIIGIINVGRI